MTSDSERAAGDDTAGTPVLPLQGVRVVELTHAWAGPVCGMMLADMGAEVIKVESPRQTPEARGGFPYGSRESVIFMMTHRNKKSVAIDLKSPSGMAAFRRLIETTDVLVQNMRPGTLERLGCGYEELSKINPRLIYTSVSGFGPVGPDAGRAGVDLIAIAMSGLAATTMSHGLDKPIFLGAPVCDIMGAMWACHGVLCAYIARNHTQKGQKVDSSLLGAGFAMMIAPVALHYFMPGYQGFSHPGNGPCDFYMTADQRWIAVFASYPGLWDRFIVLDEFASIRSDKRFETRNGRSTYWKDLFDALSPIFASKTCLEWEAILREAGVPAARVNSIAEAMEDPQIKAMGLLQTVEHATEGPIRVLGIPVVLSETPASVRTPAPLLGQDTEAILRTLPLAESEIQTLLEAARSPGH